MKKRTKKNNSNKLYSILIRYSILLVIGLIVAFTDIPYKILLPLTIYPLSFVLGFFYNTIVLGEIMILSNISIELIPACIAISAFYLLLILNLTTPIGYKRQAQTIIFSLLSLLLINILRLIILSIFLIKEYAGFEVLHEVFWYVLSIFIVVGIWFLTVQMFKIKEIPIYSDIRSIIKILKHHS